MIRIPGKIPVTIYPTFWILALLIGFLFSNGDLLQTAIWAVIIFVSVLFHEYGHALTALCFGRHPRIDLVALGGLTYHDGDKLSFGRQFLITLNGPLFGFLLGLIAYGIVLIPAVSTSRAAPLLLDIRNINWFWTVINLVPVLPLDGGQLLRIVLEGIFHAKGIRYALIASGMIAFGVSLVFFVMQMVIAGAFFFLFAFENFTAYKRSQNLTDSDQKESVKQLFAEAESLMRSGQREEALALFEKLRGEAKQGLIFIASTQFAAFLFCELGRKHEAYLELVPIKDKLDPEGICLLHKLAYEENNFPLVAELAGPVFQLLPEPDVALRNAMASANLKDASSTIGWLESAAQTGVQNISEIVQESVFDGVRGDPHFQEFIKRL